MKHLISVVNGLVFETPKTLIFLTGWVIVTYAFFPQNNIMHILLIVITFLLITNIYAQLAFSTKLKKTKPELFKKTSKTKKEMFWFWVFIVFTIACLSFSVESIARILKEKEIFIMIYPFSMILAYILGNYIGKNIPIKQD